MHPLSRERHSAPADSAGNAQPELFPLLEEWRRLTELESEAIRREDWAAVAAHQEGKQGLRDAITSAQRRQHASPASNPASDPAQSFKALLAEVIALERRNVEVLSAKRQRRQEELQRLNQSTRHLQGLRRAYGTGSQSCWQSYS